MNFTESQTLTGDIHAPIHSIALVDDNTIISGGREETDDPAKISRKKLRQIETLKAKPFSELNDDQRKKIAEESALRDQLSRLEGWGEGWGRGGGLFATE